VIHILRPNRTYGGTEPACFDYQTLGDELDRAGLPWRYYVAQGPDPGSNFSAYRAVNHIRNGPDWATDVITPQTQILTDVANGSLAAVTWVTPDYRDSDHSHSGGTGGPSWVASVVNAIGQSQFWNTTAIFILWDDWGGWYDHVPPPYADYDGLGVRVPLIVVSPYAKAGYASHVQYEFGSVLRFIEDDFGLAQLSASDARATDPAADCFDFSQPPRTFSPIAASLKPATIVRRRPSLVPPDGD
jgi:phospholipase C